MWIKETFTLIQIFHCLTLIKACYYLVSKEPLEVRLSHWGQDIVAKNLTVPLSLHHLKNLKLWSSISTEACPLPTQWHLRWFWKACWQTSNNHSSGIQGFRTPTPFSRSTPHQSWTTMLTSTSLALFSSCNLNSISLSTVLTTSIRV